MLYILSCLHIDIWDKSIQRLLYSYPIVRLTRVILLKLHFCLWRDELRDEKKGIKIILLTLFRISHDTHLLKMYIMASPITFAELTIISPSTFHDIQIFQNLIWAPRSLPCFSSSWVENSPLGKHIAATTAIFDQKHKNG